MSYRDWHVGMKVVYIGLAEGLTPTGPVPLEEGKVYTIRDLKHLDKGEFVKGLDGIVSKMQVDMLHVDVGVVAWCPAVVFRPLQKRKTDISVFHEILDKVHERTPLQVPLS